MKNQRWKKPKRRRKDEPKRERAREKKKRKKSKTHLRGGACEKEELWRRRPEVLYVAVALWESKAEAHTHRTTQTQPHSHTHSHTARLWVPINRRSELTTSKPGLLLEGICGGKFSNLREYMGLARAGDVCVEGMCWGECVCVCEGEKGGSPHAVAFRVSVQG